MCVCDAHRSIDVHDHLSSGLVAFAVVGSFLFLLQHAVSGGSVLERKLAEDFTEPVDADLSHTVGRVTEEQQEGVEPGRRNERNYSKSSTRHQRFDTFITTRVQMHMLRG